jgi:hypothetical protein
MDDRGPDILFISEDEVRRLGLKVANEEKQKYFEKCHIFRGWKY